MIRRTREGERYQPGLNWDVYRSTLGRLRVMLALFLVGPRQYYGARVVIRGRGPGARVLWDWWLGCRQCDPRTLTPCPRHAPASVLG